VSSRASEPSAVVDERRRPEAGRVLGDPRGAREYPVDGLFLGQHVTRAVVREPDVGRVEDRVDLEDEERDRARDEELQRQRALREVHEVDRERREDHDGERCPGALGQQRGDGVERHPVDHAEEDELAEQAGEAARPEAGGETVGEGFARGTAAWSTGGPGGGLRPPACGLL
jgi:hypothetical protein